MDLFIPRRPNTTTKGSKKIIDTDAAGKCTDTTAMHKTVNMQQKQR